LLPAAAEAGVDFAQPFRPEFTNTKPNFWIFKFVIMAYKNKKKHLLVQDYYAQ
jgi:hypothetical protein